MTGTIGICFLLSGTGYAEDQSAGFYAGPLSAVIKVISKKIKPKPEAAAPAVSDVRGESGRVTEKEARLVPMQTPESFAKQSPASVKI